jgi:bifunctional non-homologous end joining protein LigD
MARRAAARKLRSIAPKGARVSAYPGFVSYCDPTLSEQAPRGDGWAHEIKADGYRAEVHVIDGKVHP